MRRLCHGPQVRRRHLGSLLPSTPRTPSLRSPHPPSQKFPFLLAQKQHVPPLALAHLRLPVTAQAPVGVTRPAVRPLSFPPLFPLPPSCLSRRRPLPNGRSPQADSKPVGGNGESQPPRVGLQRAGGQTGGLPSSAHSLSPSRAGVLAAPRVPPAVPGAEAGTDAHSLGPAEVLPQ